MKIGISQQTSKPHRNHICGALSLVMVKVRNTQVQPIIQIMLMKVSRRARINHKYCISKNNQEVFISDYNGARTWNKSVDNI